MSKSVSMGCQNSFSIRPPLHSRVAMRSRGSGGRKKKKIQPQDFYWRLLQTLAASQISSPGPKTNSLFLEWPVLPRAHDQTEWRRRRIAAVGSQQSSLSEGANLFSWFRPPDISLLFLSALQRWWYQTWHALSCFWRCSQSCSGWCICIRCARLRCRKWSSSLWAFIIYTTWPTFRRPDGRGTASVGARASLPVAAFAERCLLKAKF